MWRTQLAEPERVLDAVRACTSNRKVVVTGALDRRLVLIEHETHAEWTIADLSGQPLVTRVWSARG
ncbi:hypothetical protein SAMN05216174_115153 [Actinokineospora iranica]|uniref:Uncharacterized protein n=1 Tax=Actinokineospora iranica TaxID=1271860 RepID=A0A1G6WUJ9_9PSEU|nr:hypothetical protein SAMN05216174_115153 [Actinokineospora iranica]